MLRGHVGRGPTGSAGEGQIGVGFRFGNTEIDNFHLPLLVEHDVARLDIAMVDSLLVSKLQNIKKITDDLQRLFGGEFPFAFDPFLERYAFDVLHGDDGVLAVAEEVFNPADAGVAVKQRQLVGFMPEPFPQAGIAEYFQDNIEVRHVLVNGQVDFGHPPLPDFLEHSVAADKLLFHSNFIYTIIATGSTYLWAAPAARYGQGFQIFCDLACERENFGEISGVFGLTLV